MCAINNYIFDFDGTLMDTQGVILSTILTTIKDLNLPPRSLEQCKGIIGIRTNEAAGVLYPELPDFNAEFAAKFRQNYDVLKRDADTKLFAGVMDVLRECHESGRGMAIASSRRHASLDEYLDGLGIRDWFAMVVGADDVLEGKPNPEPVLKILSALDWNPAQTIVVGDAPVDILMGKGAGCLTCAVTYGNGTREGLAEVAPDYIIDRFDDLPR